MFRLMMACVVLLPGVVRADVTCAEMQVAFHVPPPLGEQVNPDGLFGCSDAALRMFAINETALDEAKPVVELADLHGAWLGDRVLPYVSGVRVPGQEVLIFAAAQDPETVDVTQYWMKAASPFSNQLWSETGDYLGVAAQAVLQRDRQGAFVVQRFGEAVRYGAVQLELERSRDLAVKAQLNHFELPFTLRLAGDVLVLDGAVRDPDSRTLVDYARSYTRVSPDAAEMALRIVRSQEVSQSRFFDCLTHQLSDQAGPLFDVMGHEGVSALNAFARLAIAHGQQTEELRKAMRVTDDTAKRDQLAKDMMAMMKDYVTNIAAPETREMLEQFSESSDSICPNYF